MRMMDTLLSIVKMEGKCPICEHKATIFPKSKRKGLTYVHGNESFSHYKKGVNHFVIREQISEIVETLELSLC